MNFMGHEIVPRPLTIEFSKRVYDATVKSHADVAAEVMRVAESEKAGKLYMPQGLEERIMAAFVATVAILAEFYDLKDLEIMKRATLAQVVDFIKVQVEISSEDDFLLDPLKVLALILSARQEAHRLRNTSRAVIDAIDKIKEQSA